MQESTIRRYNGTLDKLNKRQRLSHRKATTSSLLLPISSPTNYGKRKDKYSVAIPNFFYWVCFVLFSIAMFATTGTTVNMKKKKNLHEKSSIEKDDQHYNNSNNAIVSKLYNESESVMEQEWSFKGRTVNESQFSSQNDDGSQAKLYPFDAIISDGLTSKITKRESKDNVSLLDSLPKTIKSADDKGNNLKESDTFETKKNAEKNSFEIYNSTDNNESKIKYKSFENVKASKINSESKASKIPNVNSKCLKSITNLSMSEMNPVKGERHMVQPPSDVNGTISLVCCETTSGSLSIAVHSNWAPLGAARFLEMVDANYFSSQVPLMRCIRNFLCQFGIAGDPSLNAPPYKTSILDDPNWLPEGPKYRTNANGIKRYSRGYMAYAGAGKNSRSQQFIMALGDNERLGGGSPWEVPWGEVVGIDSYHTMDAIYTGYGENGPKQGRLMKEGASIAIRNEFPYLDYITSCHVVDKVVFT